MVWDRRRTQRMFDFEHPPRGLRAGPKRVHGYFAMPLLTGGRLAGRVDPGRDGRTLLAKQLTVTGVGARGDGGRTARGGHLGGSDNVALDRVDPSRAGSAAVAMLG